MASVTQQIPTLTGGISQQADELKVPGQVNVADNVLPDVTHGLQKRPGGQFVKSLSDGTNNSVTDGRWFHYYRDEAEQYIGQIGRDGDVNMWKCSDGSEMTVTSTLPTTSTTATYARDAQGVITVTKTSHGFEVNEVVNLDFTTGTAVDGRYKILEKTDNTFKVSDSTTASTSGNVTITQQYLMHIDDEDVQSLTINDFTFLTNRTRTVDMSATVEPVRPPEVFIELKTVKYASQYNLNLFDTTATTSVSTVTRIRVDQVNSSNNYCNSSGQMETHANRITQTDRCTGNAFNGDDEQAPNVGTRIFDIGSGENLVDDEAAGGTLASGSISDTSYAYSVSIYNAANQPSQTGRKNLYFRITCTGQSYPISASDYRTRYTVTNDLLYGGEGWVTGDYFYVFMKDARYKVTVEEVSTSQVQANLGLIRPNPTSFDTKTTVTAQSILGTLRESILGTSYSGSNTLYQWKHDTANGYYVEQIGNGLYISRPTSEGTFNANTPNSSLINVVSGSVPTVEDLPKQCKHGMVIRIANSESTDNDDYYVKFIGNNDRDGDGVWEECAMPGTQIEYDKTTMPVQLVRTNSTTFTLSQVDYEQCNAGDTTATTGTNPRATFVGKTINKMVFFRNRLVMLSDENVIMSRPGNFFNFWAKTAQTFANIDVIDIQVSSTYPAIVFDAIQVNAGLLVFTKNQQFMLTTDSDVLSPATAKINALANYNFNHKTNPISLGTTVGFLDNANKYSRFFEMSNLLREGEPIVVEQSKVVSTLLSNNLKLISNSRENSIIFFSEEDTSTLYAYRYFQSGNERGMEAWVTWTLTGTIRYHCMLDDALYVVVKNGVKDQLLKFDITLDTTSNFVTSGTDFPVHLDHSMSVTTAGNTYNSTTGKTTFPKPIGLESSAQLAAYDNSNNASGVQNLGRYAKITVNGSNLELDGDWSGETFVIGYLFDMQIQIPTIYLTQQAGENWRADTRCDLIIHRIKFNFGNVGVYSITIDKQGKATFTEEREVNQANLSTANNPNFLQGSFESVPCYERNKTLTVNVSSKHPSPATIYSYNWEGDYNNKNYRRV